MSSKARDLSEIAPDSGTDFDLDISGGVTIGGTLTASGNVDVNGNELILDADGDTSITADTDDQIDFKTGGTDRMVIDSSGQVGIGIAAPLGQLHLKSDDFTDQVIIENTDSTSTHAPDFVLYRNSSSAADNDWLGAIFWRGNDNLGNSINYASMYAVAEDITDTTENGQLVIRTQGSAALRTRAVIGSAPDSIFQTAVAVAGINVIDCYNSNNSNAGRNLLIRNYRSASSAYDNIRAYSGNGAGNSIADVEFRVRGDGQVYADGSFNGGGADYAEMFEWDDDNSSNEDRRGYSVVLTNGNKIRKATSSDAAADIIGVISAHPTLIGDAEWSTWGGKYNRDDFGSYVLETYTLTKWTETDAEGEPFEVSYETDKIPSDVTVPADATVVTTEDDGTTLLKRRQLNSSYDDTQTYTPREDRQEWDAVGMMGKLRLRAGQPTGDRWIKMRDIATDDDGNVTVEEWLVR